MLSQTLTPNLAIAWSILKFSSNLSSRVEHPRIWAFCFNQPKKGTPVKGPFLGAAEIALPGVADAALRLGPALRLPGISVQLVRLPRGREDTGER